MTTRENQTARALTVALANVVRAFEQRIEMERQHLKAQRQIESAEVRTVGAAVTFIANELLRRVSDLETLSRRRQTRTPAKAKRPLRERLR